MRSRQPFITAILAVAGILPLKAAAQQPEVEQAEVRAVVNRYLHGLKFNDTTSFRSAFWPQALLLFVKRDSTFGRLTQPAWYRSFAGIVGKEQLGDLRIAAIDVTDDAASVKVVETYPRSIYVDYLNLLRIYGTWWIVNKVYTSRTR